MDDCRLPFLDGVAAVLVGADGRVLGCTAALEELLALPADALRGRAVRELLLDPGESSREVAAGTAGGIEQVAVQGGDGRPVSLEVRVLTLRGTDPHDPQAPRYLLVATSLASATRRRQDGAFTRELFLQDRIGLAVFDETLRLVRTNTHLLPYTGLPGDPVGGRLGDFLMPQDAAAVEAHLRTVLATGRPLVVAEELVRTLIDPRGGRMMAISAFRLQDGDGAVIGVTALFTDVTEQYRTHRRLALLHQVTASMGGTLSVSGVAQELARALVLELADSAVVDVAAAAVDGGEPRPDGQGRLLVRRTAVAGSVDSTPAFGDAFMVDDAFLLDAGEGADVGGHRDDWAMTAPLSARGMPFGRIAVHRARRQDPYTPEDRALLREIAARATLALDNAHRYTREHRAAVSLQRSLLPPAERSVTAVSTASVYLPTDRGGVGGDWFDVIPLSSTRVALVVGDVTGHGLHASASMGRMRTAVRTLADLDLEPAELLVHLDDLVSQLLTEAAFTDTDSDVESDSEGDTESDGAAVRVGRDRPPADPFGGTCLYAVYDPIARTCVAASAGHPPPAVAKPDGSTGYLPVVPGPPLGVGGLPFEAAEVTLDPGSVLALYTDGLIERGEGDIDAGMAELLERLAQVSGEDLALRDAGQRIVVGLPPTRLRDDVTLLLARTKVVPAADIALWTIEPDPQAVARVRADATRQLATWGLSDLAFTTELVLSELVTNAIRYATGPVTVRMIRAAVLTCEVSDASSTQPRMRRARPTDEGGRGLYLVAQLTSRWGSRYTALGKTIWTEQPLPDR